MKQVLILLFLFICTKSFSQNRDSVSKPDLIYLNGFGWKKGDMKLNSYALRKEIYNTADAIPYFKKGKTKAFISYLFFTIGGSLIFVAINGFDYHYYNASRNNQRNTVASAVLASFIAGGLMLHLSLRDIGKAVHLRNLDILKQ
jgi:hypothetical protein